MIKYIGTAINQFDTEASGNAYAGATVTVRDFKTGAKAFLANESGEDLGNPIKAANDGSFEFFIVSGLYNIIFNEGAATEKTNKNVIIGKAESTVVNTVADLANCFVPIGDFVSVESLDGARYKCIEGNSLVQGDVNTSNNRYFRPIKNVPSKTFNIPTDFPTLQTAIDALAGSYLTNRGIEIIINIESGHRLTNGLLLTDGDFSYFRITSDDAEVLLSSGFTPVDSSIVSESLRAIMFFNAAKSPIIDCVINAQAKDNYDFDGIVGHAGAFVYVDRDAGVKGARFNLLIRAASCYAKYTIWDNAGRNCARFTEKSDFVISNSSLNESWQKQSDGSASDAALHISRSSMGQAQDCIINDSDFSAVTVRRSWVYLFGTAIGDVGLRGQSSTSVAIRPFDGAHIITNGVTFKGNALTPNNCNVVGFNNPSADGVVYNNNGPAIIADINSTSTSDRTINIYDAVRIRQIRVENVNLDAPDINVPISGIAGEGFYSAYVNVDGAAWMAGANFTNRLAAVNGLVVGVTNDNLRIRQISGVGFNENVDLIVTIIGSAG